MDIFYDPDYPEEIYLESGAGCIRCNKLTQYRIDELFEMQYHIRIQEIQNLRKNEYIKK